MNAGSEYCLNVRRPANDTYSPGVYSTLAVVGFNATYIWRTARYVYTPAVGANATLGFARNPLPLAAGNYYLGTAAAYRDQNVAGYYLSQARISLFGPLALT